MNIIRLNQWAWIGLVLLLMAVSLSCSSSRLHDEEANLVLGKFEDDYGIQYTISEGLWIQHPDSRYHIFKWNWDEQYLVARNDADNPADGQLWTRIDWVKLDMPPYEWAFCMSAYNAPTQKEAERTLTANRESPRTGCNGFPFSRMKVKY